MINSQLSTSEPKNNKLSKQLEQEQIHRNRDDMEGYQRGELGKGTGNQRHKWQVQNRQGEVKNSIGNVEDKELICMTHGHELKNVGQRWCAGQTGTKG